MSTPVFTASPILSSMRCPGMISFAELMMATRGREICSLMSPSALSRLRCGALDGPAFMRSLVYAIPAPFPLCRGAASGRLTARYASDASATMAERYVTSCRVPGDRRTAESRASAPCRDGRRAPAVPPRLASESPRRRSAVCRCDAKADAHSCGRYRMPPTRSTCPAGLRRSSAIEGAAGRSSGWLWGEISKRPAPGFHCRRLSGSKDWPLLVPVNATSCIKLCREYTRGCMKRQTVESAVLASPPASWARHTSTGPTT